MEDIPIRPNPTKVMAARKEVKVMAILQEVAIKLKDPTSLQGNVTAALADTDLPRRTTTAVSYSNVLSPNSSSFLIVIRPSNH